METQRNSEDSISTLDLENSSSSHASAVFTPSIRLFFSFLLFGTLIAMQFSVVITAANDLVRDRAPIGSILFAYTLPSVLVRITVPFIRFPELCSPISLLSQLYRKGYRGEDADKSCTTGGGGSLYSSASSLTVHVNYPLRLTICVLSSFFGLQLLAWVDYTGVRLLGIAMASLSSNLGDMSFLQLCSHYPNTAFGGYTTGSGCAALVGSFIYTFSTSTLHFSPSGTISVIGFFPAIILFTYALLLPNPSCESAKKTQTNGDRRGSIDEESISSLPMISKLRIARPLFWRYMAPLATVMLIENTVVQGILPTLLFSLPFPTGHDILNAVFRHNRDFYPVYVTIYQFFIFVGRSSISFFRPPSSFLLCILQAVILTLQVTESISMSSDESGTLYGPLIVLYIIAAMGLFGGFAFSETYWRVRNGALPKGVWRELERARGGYRMLGGVGGAMDDCEGERAMREFLLSAVAPPDTIAVLVASLVGMKVQNVLCEAQVLGGRLLCQHTGN